MSPRALRALLLGITLATVAGWSSLLGLGVVLSLIAGIIASLVLFAAAWALRERFDGFGAWLRERAWADRAGHHHAFGGTALDIEDDGRHVWIAGPGLLRVLGRREPDDVLAARMPGQWRRSERGVLQLRVDAVVDYLAHMPGRDDLRVQKFRRYLERDVLHPAAQRRARR